MRLLMTMTFLLLTCASQLAVAMVSPVSQKQCQRMLNTGVINNNSPVPCHRLSRVSFKHVNFEGKEQQGELIVLDAVATYVEKIMQQLFVRKFPINSAKPMSYFAGDDERSMNANNSSAFNHRTITGKRNLSLHAYGVAIDINPLQNPYISFTTWGTATFKPLQGHQYLNRKQVRRNKANAQGFAEQIIDLFADNGFRIWGGDWDSPIDFQHFQVSREMAVLMSQMPAEHAKLLFAKHVEWYHQCQSFINTAQHKLLIKDYTWQLKQQLQQGIKDIHLSQAYQNVPQNVLTAINKNTKAQPKLCF